MPCASTMSKSTIQAALASSTSSRSDGTAFGSGFGPRTTCSTIGFSTTNDRVPEQATPRHPPIRQHRRVRGARPRQLARRHVGKLWRGITRPDVRRPRRHRDPRRPLGHVLGDDLARRVVVPRRRLLRPRRGPVPPGPRPPPRELGLVRVDEDVVGVHADAQLPGAGHGLGEARLESHRQEQERDVVVGVLE